MKFEDKAAIKERRKFLEMVAKAGISTGVLRASPIVAGLMTGRYASAAEATNKRVFMTFFPGGITSPDAWMPSSLSSMATATKALGPVASFCNFSLISMGGGGHGGANWVLGGGYGGSSIDVLLSQTAMGATSSYSRLALGAEARGPSQNGKPGQGTDLIGRAGNTPVVPYDDPNVAFAELFTSPTAGGAAIAAYNKQKAALDLNLAAINSIKNKLSSDEKARLDVHAASIEKIEARLKKSTEAMLPEVCKTPARPSKDDSSITDAFTKNMRDQIDVGVAALQCGLTNIVTLQMSNTQCDWIYNGNGFSTGQHEAVHGSSNAINNEIVNYQSGMAAYLLQRLANTTDPATGAKLIDSTVYLQVCDFGKGSDHVTDGAPTIVASKMAGFAPGVGGGGSLKSTLSKVAQGLGQSAVAAKFA